MEFDPNGKNPHEPGAKLDAGKIPVFQGLIDYFPNACMAVAEVSAHGASKYAWKSWQHVPNALERYSDALGRHQLYEAMGEIRDKDSGLLHKAHAAWNALAVLEMYLREEKNGTKRVSTTGAINEAALGGRGVQSAQLGGGGWGTLGSYRQGET